VITIVEVTTTPYAAASAVEEPKLTTRATHASISPQLTAGR